MCQEITIAKMATQNLSEFIIEKKENYNEKKKDMEIDSELKLNHGIGMIYLKPISSKNSEGYFEFTPDGEILDTSEVAIPAQEQINSFIEILDLLSYYPVSVEFKNLELENKINGEKFTVTKSITSRQSILKKRPVVTKDLGDIPNLLSKLKSNTIINELKRSIRWLRTNKGNPTDEFISKWISLNILYAAVSSKKGDKKSLVEFLENYPELKIKENIVSEHKNLQTQLTKMNLISIKNNENYSQNLDSAIQKNDCEQIWKYMGLGIYQIRNNLFHKGFVISDEDLFEINAFLRDVIRFGLIAFLAIGKRIVSN